MRIAVTGAAGFIGSHLVRALRAQHPSAHVVGVDRVEPRQRDADVEYTSQLTPADLVFHLAGSRGIAESMRDPASDLRDNVLPALDVLEKARGGDFQRVVLASSAAVYGRIAGSVDEEAPLRPVSPYGVSKLSVENYARVFHEQFNVDARIARIGNVYGPGQRRLVVHDLALRALSDEPPLRVKGRPNDARDFVHVADVCRALVLIGFEGAPGRSYNIGSGTLTSIADLATTVALAAGFGADDVVFEGPPDEGKVSSSQPSIARLRSLGFSAEVPLDRGVQETVDWLRRGSVS